MCDGELGDPPHSPSPSPHSASLHSLDPPPCRPHPGPSPPRWRLQVVLEIKGEVQLRALSVKLGEAGVAHKLWVEQPEGVATCLATAPAPKSVVAPHLKKLKLCKGN